MAAWLNRLEAEHDNFRAALAWSAAAEPELGLALALALGQFWEFRGHVAEGLQLLDRALAGAGDAEPGLRARALMRSGIFAQMRGELDDATARLEAAVELAAESGDRVIFARSLRNLGTASKDRGEYQRAHDLQEEARVIAEELGDLLGVSISLTNLADVSLARGEYTTAADVRARECVRFALASARVRLGRITPQPRSRQPPARSTRRCRRRVRRGARDLRAHELRRRRRVCIHRARRACGRRPATSEMPRSSSGPQTRCSTDVGAVLESTERPLRDETLERLRSALGSEALEAQLAEGAALPFGEAVATARRLAADVVAGDASPTKPSR